MTPTEAAQILAVCVQTWPTMQVGDRTGQVWAQALATTDVGCAQEAVRRLIQTDEYPPTPARIISAARGIAAGRNEHRALGAGSVQDRARSAQAIRAMNALYAQMNRPAHDHRQGREACPSCSTAADRLTVFAHDAADLLGDYGVTIDAERAARHATEGHPG